MRTILIIIIPLVVVAGGYYFFGPSQTENISTDIVTPEGSASLAVPALGNENSVDEMIVSEDANAPKAKEFAVTAKNFSYSTNEIRVNQGDTVRINFTSTDGFHDFVVDEIDGAKTVRVNTGDSTSVEFIATEAGTFEFYCSVGSHRSLGMVGNLIVE